MNFKQFYIKEAVTTQATNMERAITEYYKNGQLPKELESLSDATSLICKEMEKRYSKFFGKIGKVDAEHLGSGTFQCSQEWKDYNIKTSVPKTDIIVNKQKLSLKMGESQLTTEGRAGQMALFGACSKQYKNQFKDGMVKVVNNYVKQIEEKFLDNKRAETLADVADAENYAKTVIKEMQSGLNDIFNNDEFKKIYIKEAMSGELKFGDNSPARAVRILAFTPDGIETKIHLIEEDEYVASITHRVKARVSFKSASIKLNGVKTGGRILRSVIRAGLGDEKKTKTKNESFDMILNEELELLNEGISSAIKHAKDKIKEVAKKIIDFIKRIATHLKDAISKGVNYFLDFLELEAEIDGLDEPIQFV